MMDNIEYSVIMPTYNERENVCIAIWLIDEVMQKCNVKYEIIVVDDSSPDGTADQIRKMEALLGPDKVKLCSRPGKLGLGTAYVHGLKYARGPFVIIMDADLSHNPKFIADMIQKQLKTNCDIVTGTRYSQGGGVNGWNTKRKLISCTANYLTQILLNIGVSDMTGSFRLYKKRVLSDLIQCCFSKGFVFQMEIIVVARRLGFSIEEVPIAFVDRMFGQSKLSGQEVMQFVSALLTLSLSTQEVNPPMSAGVQ